ncbi:DUF159-domain-containing protein [Thelephora ganbajun]|uniref:DUF159-domain-containing protein n=1 Tax=Thelephora ganbajun TaxID=370292 RepID=A0ACB6ZJF7_THEGA|nr:DUF159-domain-containing protein [Thelephora ganbajun]
MCGRYALGLTQSDVQQLDGYNLDIGEWVDEDAFFPRYNIAPRSFAPVDNKLATFNTRAENLVETGGLWESMKKRKRCIVVAHGYYEWQKKGPKDRVPHFIKHKDGRLMLFAGLYDCANLEGSEHPLWSFSIITTPASKDFEWLHDRQPVILVSEDDIVKWLDPNTDKWTKELSQLVQPAETHPTLQCYPVSPDVGKVGNESPTFIEPVSKRKDGIMAMFASQGSQKSKTPSPAKRKRSTSPPPAKKPRIANLKDDSDSEIELVGYGKSDPKDKPQSSTKLSQRAPSNSPPKLSSLGRKKEDYRLLQEITDG